MEKRGKWDWEKWEICPKSSHFSMILLLFPINFTHFSYISQNVLLVISHNSPSFSISPQFPQFPSISPHFPPLFHLPHTMKPLRLVGQFGCG